MCELIHSCIEHLDHEHHKAILDQSSLEDAEELDDVPAVDHIYLSSLQKLMSFNAMEQVKSSDWAFWNFHKEFITFINIFADAHAILLPNGTPWFVSNGQDKVCFRVILLHRMLQISLAQYSFSIDPRILVP